MLPWELSLLTYVKTKECQFLFVDGEWSSINCTWPLDCRCIGRWIRKGLHYLKPFQLRWGFGRPIIWLGLDSFIAMKVLKTLRKSEVRRKKFKL
jgi:hypothetical protein